ncbi:MAG: T9SS type A sorting domain-containing protein [Saprospiraceae bacterium]|uniref:T9SS type A sorting domain-containing protein n=1 Tax=Candidatus Opimibacter skivensis TaxID=2982028 RepID=A0A9D7XSN6_9BACT|nr:T9SS type A sorting domain-containing protein [Candidatus Opimibacter skivensis]
MRKLYFITLSVAILAVGYKFWPAHDFLKEDGEDENENALEDFKGALDDYKFTSSDVDLGYIPYDKLINAVAEGQRRSALHTSGRSRNEDQTNAIWHERGPNNVGGRTRAIMIDEGDPSRNRIWVGGVGGGLWRTEDISQPDPKWKQLAYNLDNIAIGFIAQDPNDLKVIYVGTGEGYNNLDAISGAGIFKTTDDGETWSWLPSTKNSNFSNIHRVFVAPNGDVYAGTQVGGLLRSKNGGGTWEKVLGSSLSGASNNNFYDFHYNTTNQTFYASNANSLFKSTTGDRGSWTDIGTSKPGFPHDLSIVEFDVCPSDPNVMYVLGNVNSAASNTYVSNDGGASWVSRPAPGGFGDFTNGQAWYDLDIAADPFNCGRILAGGVGMQESIFQGINWASIGDGQFHVDQHFILFDPKKSGRVFFGNDGGIWMSENGGQTILTKNKGYVTTQYYCGAIHPDEGSPYILGGTQDNNTLQISQPGLSPSKSVWGGDGIFCFIDQNEPDIQIVSSQNANYGLSTDGGNQFGFGASINGEFINRSGYDDDANILYGQINTGGFFRWDIASGNVEEVNVTGQGLNVSAVKADPFVANRIYFGGGSGRVLQVDNANVGNPVQAKLIADLPGTASVSCFYMDKQTPNDMLISLFNFGATLKNIWLSTTAGDEWHSIEGDLPDMPVRWAIFDPANHDRVMLATEAGIWTTEDVDGDLTHWEPANPDNGMPYVSVYMLQVRETDKVVLAATHGRGMMTTDVFSSAAAVIVSKPVAYVGQSVVIDGSQSVNANSLDWDLGDNSTSSEPIVNHTFTQAGTYTISLTINGVIVKTKQIIILPYLDAPYETGDTGYAGDFESSPDHFAGYLVNGTGFELGSSIKPGKDGVNSGSKAWVLGPNDNLYLNNTEAYLYTPMFDFSQSGLYELKFWTKYAVENRNDGFQIEYSLDGGDSWQQLGTSGDPHWYNYHNTNIANGAFPEGKDYFTNAQLGWAQYVKDVSFLTGESTVSFRYVFKSDASEQAQGLAIDDFEVSKYEGELKTTVTSFTADYTGAQEVTINWTTGIEYQCHKFILERSYTGIGFTQINEVNALGIVSTIPQHYTSPDQSLRNVIYYRLKVINNNPAIGYYEEFYTDPIVVRRDVDPELVHAVLPNPFADRIGISFSSVINQEVTMRLFDVSGKLVREDSVIPHSVYYEMDRLRLPPGVYILSVQIGEEKPTAYKLFTAGQ